jgi:hypothetical protein
VPTEQVLLDSGVIVGALHHDQQELLPGVGKLLADAAHNAAEEWVGEQQGVRLRNHQGDGVRTLAGQRSSGPVRDVPQPADRGLDGIPRMRADLRRAVDDAGHRSA